MIVLYERLMGEFDGSNRNDSERLGFGCFLKI